MHVLVLGGTRFVGRAVVEELVRRGSDVTVVHRGVLEPPDLPDVRHIHAPRAEWASLRSQLAALGCDAVVECIALTRDDARCALAAIPDAHVVLVSSQDVYRAFASLQHGLETDAVPLDESAPLRADRYPYRGEIAEYEHYSKLDVEEEYAARRAVVLRLPAVYGEHDRQRREEPLLRRMRAGRRRIPVGLGRLVWTRAYVRDVARGVCAAAADPRVAGEVFNVGEAASWSVRMWAERVLEAAGWDAELVTVADDVLPADMAVTAAGLRQHVLVSSAKARELLGYRDTDAMEALRASVAWHLANPPEQPDADFSADDVALATEMPGDGGDRRGAT
jgi:nucleoside-diphosphate-sugar epimerase